MKSLMRLGCLVLVALMVFGVYLVVKKLTGVKEEVDIITGKKSPASIAQKKEGFKLKLPFFNKKSTKIPKPKLLETGGTAFRTQSTSMESLEILSWNLEKSLSEAIVRIDFQVKNTGSGSHDVYWQNKYILLERKREPNDKLPAFVNIPPVSGTMQLGVQPGMVSKNLQVVYNISPRWFMEKTDPVLSWGNYDFSAKKIPKKIPLKK